MILANITQWLKANGNKEGDDNAHFSCHDEPYMRFTAEWQDWGDSHEKLFLGYSTNENGDICYDPQFVFRIEDGNILHCLYQNSLVGVAYSLPKKEIKDALQFAEVVYNRHLKNRGK